MDSLLLLCARHIVAHHPIPALPDDLYPVLFQAAFLDGRPLLLRDLVASWPSPELNFQQLVGHLEQRRDHPYIDCVEAVIQGVVAQLHRELEEPGHQSSGCRLNVVDVTGVLDDPDGRGVWTRTAALARACVELSRHQQEFQRRGSKRHKGCSGATTSEAAPSLPGMDVRADLVIDKNAYRFLCEALQTRASGPLRLKCREFQPKDISEFETVTLLGSLDPSCLQRVKLRFNNLQLTGFLVILPYLSRFPELRSLELQDSKSDAEHPTPELAIRLRCVARHLRSLSRLQELNLRCTWLSGNLRQILCYLQAPLESLELAFCSLVPADLAFLSQSIHAPALKNLDLSNNDISQGLLEPLQLLLEKTSSSLLQLDLAHCHMADSHLEALLPTLLRCSRLRFLRLYRNPLSTAAIKSLLQKTLELPALHVVVYPTPLDCYRWGVSLFSSEYFEESLNEELLSAAKAEISQLLENSGRTDLVWTDNRNHKAQDYFSL